MWSLFTKFITDTFEWLHSPSGRTPVSTESHNAKHVLKNSRLVWLAALWSPFRDDVSVFRKLASLHCDRPSQNVEQSYPLCVTKVTHVGISLKWKIHLLLSKYVGRHVGSIFGEKQTKRETRSDLISHQSRAMPPARGQVRKGLELS